MAKLRSKMSPPPALSSSTVKGGHEQDAISSSNTIAVLPLKFPVRIVDKNKDTRAPEIFQHLIFCRVADKGATHSTFSRTNNSFLESVNKWSCKYLTSDAIVTSEPCPFKLSGIANWWLRWLENRISRPPLWYHGVSPLQFENTYFYQSMSLLSAVLLPT